MRESDYQKHLIDSINALLPGCIVMKCDSSYKQGIPDLAIFYNDRWATLEVKIGKNAHHQPNQDYYVSRMNEMSFSAFIYPENEKEILYALEQSLKPKRSARLSKR